MIPDLSLDDVAAALSAIPYADDREVWVRMAMAVKSEFGDAGFDVWDQWSQTAGNYDEKAARDVWKGIRRGGGVSLGSLVSLAKEHGHKFDAPELSKDEKAERKRRAEARRKELEAQAERDEAARLEWHKRIAVACADMVKAGCLSDRGASPYLQAKKVGSYGLHFVPHGFIVAIHIAAGRVELITGKDAVSDFFERHRAEEIDPAEVSFKYIKHGTTVVPMQDLAGLWGFQFIFESGKKTFLKFGRKQGLFHLIAQQDERQVFKSKSGGPPLGGHLLCAPPVVLAIAEGYATGASVHQATGWPVAVCFDSGNIPLIAKALRGVYPDSKIVICGDDDREAKGNPGRKKALAAAKAVGGVAVFPDFKAPEVEAEAAA